MTCFAWLNLGMPKATSASGHLCWSGIISCSPERSRWIPHFMHSCDLEAEITNFTVTDLKAIIAGWIHMHVKMKSDLNLTFSVGRRKFRLNSFSWKVAQLQIRLTRSQPIKYRSPFFSINTPKQLSLLSLTNCFCFHCREEPSLSLPHVKDQTTFQAWY